MRHLLIFGVALALMAGLKPAPGHAQPASRVNSSSLDHKLIFGFQGWFGCPGDGGALNRWYHWFRDNRADPATAGTDLLPDTSELPKDEICDTGLSSNSGKPVETFSDQRKDTVIRQFVWMREHALDGVALQRFVLALGDDARHPFADQVLANVRRAAESTGRTFFVQYDTTGADPGNWDQRIREDWLKLLRDSHIGKSPAYQHHRGHIVLGITGPGAKGRPGTPDQLLALFQHINNLRKIPNGLLSLFDQKHLLCISRQAKISRWLSLRKSIHPLLEVLLP